MVLTIYHNPRCSKSRQTLALIQESGEEVEIVKYLDNPLNKNELKEIIKRLGVLPIDLIRKGEKVFKEQYKGKQMTVEIVLEALVTDPILMERPIVVRGDRAIIGRPPENVKLLL